MKVLYDPGMFFRQKRGGVSRVFLELILRGLQDSDLDIRVFAGLHRNEYLFENRQVLENLVWGAKASEFVFRKCRLIEWLNVVPFAVCDLAYRPDICHLTYYDWKPTLTRSKKVITVHDMTHELFPECFHPRDRTATQKKYAAQHADGIICVSANTKRDLVRIYGVDERKVCVIYNGNSMAGIECSARPMNDPYFLYVGRRNTYKNFPVVLAALAQSRAEKHHLVCFGGGEFNAEERELISRYGLSHRVYQMAGTDSELRGAYKFAEALVYPSKYEGFGLPVVEAMSLECPVITVHLSSIPEVAGNAGIYFDPDDADQLAQLIDRVNEDKEFRQSIVFKGIEQAKNFSWARATRDTLAFYQKLMRK